MKKFTDPLLQDVSDIQKRVENQFRNLSIAQLNFRQVEGGWSILECLEHLNRYARYYFPEIEKALKSAPRDESRVIRYSWLGKMSLDMVHPNNLKPRKTIGRMNPVGSALGKLVLDEFLDHQNHLEGLLRTAEDKNLNRKSVRVEFFRLMRMMTGETLEFLVRHEQRHLLQAEKVLSAMQVPVDSNAQGFG